MAWIDPTIFENDDPFTQCLDGFIEKLTKTEDPFGAKYLNEWCLEGNRGGLRIYSYDGTTAIDYEPPRDKCPAIVVYGSEAPAPEPHGEGDKRIHYVLHFEGWLYTKDQREGNEFYWRTLAALGMPFMNSLDPAKSVYVHRYWPVESIGPRPWPMESKAVPPFVFEITIDVEMSSASFPFFRGV